MISQLRTVMGSDLLILGAVLHMNKYNGSKPFQRGLTVLN